jgi:hypothetical protein
MMVAGKSVHRRARHRSPWVLALSVLVALAGCGAPAPRPVIPDNLPNTANQDVFVLRWALQKEAAVTRAVGRIETTNTATPVEITLGFFGLDASGRIVSRGTSWLRPMSFANVPIPFSVELTPTGQETKYELTVLNYRLPNMRMN